ncbi:hypothetical protein GCM10009713_33310 [Brevibacterium celere]
MPGGIHLPALVTVLVTAFAVVLGSAGCPVPPGVGGVDEVINGSLQAYTIGEIAHLSCRLAPPRPHPECR